MAVDEVRERTARDNHHDHGNDDGAHHHVQIVDHADRGDDGIKRKHRVKQQYLSDDDPEARLPAAVLFGVRQRLETLMQLGRRLEEQEQAAAQEDQIPERERMPPYGKDRIREGHEPRHDGKKAETHRERKPEAHVKGLVLLGRRELFGDDGDEDEIVDPENDFKNDEREKTDPDGRIKQKFHVLLRDEASDPRMPGARPKAFPIEKRTKTDASDKITIFSSAVGAFASSFHGSATSRKLFMPLSERLSSRVAAEALVLPGPEPRGRARRHRHQRRARHHLLAGSEGGGS